MKQKTYIPVLGALALALVAVVAVVSGGSVASSVVEPGMVEEVVSTTGALTTTNPTTCTVYLPVALSNYVDLVYGHPDYECYFPGYEHSVNYPWDNSDVAFPCHLAGVEQGWHYISGLKFPDGYDPGTNPPADWWRWWADTDYYNNYATASQGQVFTTTVTPPDDLYVFVYYQEEGQSAPGAVAVSSYPGEPVTITYAVHLWNDEGQPIEHWIVVAGRPLRPQETPPGEDFDTWYNWSDEPYYVEFSGGEAD